LDRLLIWKKEEGQQLNKMEHPGPEAINSLLSTILCPRVECAISYSGFREPEFEVV
jgi:hypothetical protein